MDPGSRADDARPRALAEGSSPLDHGGVVNLVGELRRRAEADAELPEITDVQTRLVMQRLEENGTWEEPRASLDEQVREIAEAMAAVSPLAPDAYRRRLEARL